jgi:hypothetical protein
MINLTVKTEARAKEIISAELEFNGLSLEDGILENTTVRCECGETNAIRWSDTLGNSDKLLIVGICDCCGDDDAWVDDVLEIR